MVNTKQLFIEITTLEEISDERIYNILHQNLTKSYIKIYSVNKVTYKDV